MLTLIPNVFQVLATNAAQALPETDKPWWTQAHLVRLNAILMICCLSAATVGYDG